MEIDKDLYQEIKEYCRLNGIKDVRSEVTRCLRHGFNILKYGDNPFQYHNPMEDQNKIDFDIPRDFVIKSANINEKTHNLEISYIGCDGEDSVVTIDIEPNCLVDITTINEQRTNNDRAIPEEVVPINEGTHDSEEKQEPKESLIVAKNRRKRKITIKKN